MTETQREAIEPARVVQSDLDLGAIIQILRRRARVIALWTLAALVVGIIYLLVTPKIYEAKTVVQVEQNERAVVSTADVVPETYGTPEILKTFEQNLDSNALLLRVAKINHLDQDPRYTSERGGLLQPLRALFSKKAGGAPADAELIRRMEGRTSVKLRRGTRLVDVVVSAQDPTLAVQLSRSLVDEYIRLDFEQKLEATKPAHDYLLHEAESLKDKLQTSEQELQKYKEQEHAVSLEDSQNIVVETLKSLNSSLADARAARIKLESDYSRVQACEGRSTDLLALPAIAASSEVQALKQRISDLEGILASLGQRYTDKSPRYLQAESELEKLHLSLEKSIAAAAEGIKASYASAKDTEERLLAALREQETHALDLNRIAIQYNVLTREVGADQAMYEAVLKQIKETQIIQGVENGSVHVVERAIVPDKAAWPKKSSVLAGSLLLGLMIGTAAAVGPVLYKAPVAGVADAEAQFGVPVLCALPRGRRAANKIFLLDHPRASTAEAIRSLRAVLLSRSQAMSGKTILFTSAMAHEGKTFAALNLAAAFAIEGRRTLFVEADLRSPSVAGQLFGKETIPGLVDVLSGQAGFEEAVRASKVEGLSILSAGSPTEIPSELLGSNRMAEMLARAAATYEHVILDSAPILEASDTLRIARLAQIVCLVARCGHTPSRAVARTIHLLISAESGIPAGLVLNDCAEDVA